MCSHWRSRLSRYSVYLHAGCIYFYADFCTGRIWGLRQVGDTWESALLYDAPFRITAIGEDEDGNLYVTNYNEGFTLAHWRRGIQAPAVLLLWKRSLPRPQRGQISPCSDQFGHHLARSQPRMP